MIETSTIDQYSSPRYKLLFDACRAKERRRKLQQAIIVGMTALTVAIMVHALQEQSRTVTMQELAAMSINELMEVEVAN